MKWKRIVSLALVWITVGAMAQRPPAPDPPPAGDLSGKWVFNRVVAGRSGTTRTQVLTLTLKQDGNKLSGEASYTTLNVQQDGTFPVHGWIEGDQVGISAWADWQGGESISIRATYKDDHLVGTKKAVHDAPHKWNLDGSIDVDYVRSPN